MSQNSKRIKITKTWIRKFESGSTKLRKQIKLNKELEPTDRTRRRNTLLRTQLKAYQAQLKSLKRELYELENYE